MTATTAGDYDLKLPVLDLPRGDLCSDATWWPSAMAFATALKTNGAHGAVVSTMGENLSEAVARSLFRQGIAEAMDAAEAAVALGTAWARPSPQPVVEATQAERTASTTLTEAAAKA